MAKEIINFKLNDAKLDHMSVHAFLNDRLRLYSGHSNVRGIPFIGDGLKEAQRKAVWGMYLNGDNLGNVERLSSKVSDCTDYHHGVGSMQGTIIGLAQDFAGSNNMPLFVAKGQFGSRKTHSAAASRYIFTKLHENFRKLFKREDDEILEQKNVGEIKIEPKFFIPLLPTVLLNGAEGMGTGHATRIFCYSPLDLKNAIIEVLDGKKLTDHDLIPSWNGFTGKVERDKETGQVKVIGDYKVINSTEIRVHELPVGLQSEKYTDMLFALEDKGVIKSFKDASDDTGFDFVLKVPRTTSYLERDELLKLFKLEARDTENLTVWNAKGFIQKYESVEKLLVDWIDWRIIQYEVRRQRHIVLTNQEITWLDEAVRFIAFYLDNTAKFRDAKKAAIYELLEANNFKMVDKLMGMSIWNLTKDKIDEIKLQLVKENEKLKKLNEDTADKMFRRELKDLKFS